MIPAVFAVDGGGTKTDLAIVDVNGHLLSHARGPALLPQVIGVNAAFQGIEGLLKHCLQSCQHPIDLVWGSLFLSGADYPSEIHALREAAAARQWAGGLSLDNDTFALLRAGSSGEPAVAVVCGTGINSVGRGPKGTFRYPAIGAFSGDWGGGKHLTEKTIWSAMRGEDGRGPRTALQEVICHLYETTTVAAAVEKLYLDKTAREILTHVPPRLLDTASAGDTVASKLVTRQAQEIVALADLASTHCGLVHEEPLILGGSILAANHPALMEPLHAELKQRQLNLTPKVIRQAPIVGAVLDALDHASTIHDVEQVFLQEWKDYE